MSHATLRFQKDENLGKKNCDCCDDHSHQDNQIDWSWFGLSEYEGFNLQKQEENEEAEEETVNLGSKRETSEDANSRNEEKRKTEDSVFTETTVTAMTSKYQFTSPKDFNSFMEGPQVMNFTVQELFVGEIDNSTKNKEIHIHSEISLEEESVNQQKTDDSVQGFAKEEGSEKDKNIFVTHIEKKNTEITVGELCLDETIDSVKIEDTDDHSQINLGEESVSEGKANESVLKFVKEEGLSDGTEENDQNCVEVSAYSLQSCAESAEKFVKEDEAAKTEDSVQHCIEGEVFEKQEEVMEEETSGFQNDDEDKDDLPNEFSLGSENFFSFRSDSTLSSEGFAISSREFESIEGKIFSNYYFTQGLEHETREPTIKNKVGAAEIGLRFDDDSIPNREADVISDDEEDDINDEYIEFEPHSGHPQVADQEMVSNVDPSNSNDQHDPSNSNDQHEHEYLVNKSIDQRLTSEALECDPDDDDRSGWDILVEHQDLIKQLKAELKTAKTRGLPTILEESESLKMVEDLKPLKIEIKLGYKDEIEEVQKFYKSYADKMRKLDILNYQAIYAIRLLHLKDSSQLSNRSSTSMIKSLLSRSLSSKSRRVGADPMKYVKDLHRDLETVYIGQLCISWEILHWQYRKAKELLKYTSHGSHRFNQVAGEFQQFHVLLQRFMENEPFQGQPRIQYYAKNRFLLHNICQVPVIQDDDKMGRKAEKDENAISCEILIEHIKESMRVFWEFLRSDKGETNLLSKGFQAPHVDLQDPADSELLQELRVIFEKKDKKLKDLLRSGNCIVKKFQKHRMDRLDRKYFFPQVEMGLVSRVLSMSRLTTDQLLWCHKKLNKIVFVNRVVHIEPSFLLFPC
ncbi:Protein of unknown function DUF1666 [Dillenia turbinata]|uniref:Uncharacterized protein n=1 Tax=Dillenia turbinata TaxID=194707 RepID=A0AAN8ZAQ3_9MAGN